MAFKFNPVDQKSLTQLLAKPATRGRSSKGGDLLEEFLSSGQVAAEIDLGNTKARNSIALSASNAAKARDAKVWIRKQGGGSGSSLLLINLDKADAATNKAYDNRPRVGRRPK